MAREPEPDLDLDDLGDEIDEKPRSGVSRPLPKRSSSRKPIHWILFLLIIAAGGFFAYDPEMAMDLLGLNPRQPPPPMIVTPAPRPRPQAPVAQPPSQAPLPTTPGQSPAPLMPGSAPATASAPRPSSTPTPRFAEGQRVLVAVDVASPNRTVTLSPDPAGSRPGPAIQPGSMLIVTDGELRDNGWVYSVRTADGLTGWLPERQLASHQ